MEAIVNKNTSISLPMAVGLSVGGSFLALAVSQYLIKETELVSQVVKGFFCGLLFVGLVGKFASSPSRTMQIGTNLLNASSGVPAFPLAGRVREPGAVSGCQEARRVQSST